MSLAMALAAGRAAKNIILLGDPQQLEQPQQAVHPHNSGVAALSHILGNRDTIARGQGTVFGFDLATPPVDLSIHVRTLLQRSLNKSPRLVRPEVFGDSPYVVVA